MPPKTAAGQSVPAEFAWPAGDLMIPACYHCTKAKGGPFDCKAHQKGDKRLPCQRCKQKRLTCNAMGRVPRYDDPMKSVWYIGAHRRAHNTRTVEEPQVNPDDRRTKNGSYLDDLVDLVKEGYVRASDDTGESALKWKGWRKILTRDDSLHKNSYVDLFIAEIRRGGNRTRSKGKQPAQASTTKRKRGAAASGAAASSSSSSAAATTGGTSTRTSARRKAAAATTSEEQTGDQEAGEAEDEDEDDVEETWDSAADEAGYSSGEEDDDDAEASPDELLEDDSADQPPSNRPKRGGGPSSSRGGRGASAPVRPTPRPSVTPRGSFTGPIAGTQLGDPSGATLPPPEDDNNDQPFEHGGDDGPDFTMMEATQGPADADQPGGPTARPSPAGATTGGGNVNPPPPAYSPRGASASVPAARTVAAPPAGSSPPSSSPSRAPPRTATQANVSAASSSQARDPAPRQPAPAPRGSRGANTSSSAPAAGSSGATGQQGGTGGGATTQQSSSGGGATSQQSGSGGSGGTGGGSGGEDGDRAQLRQLLRAALLNPQAAQVFGDLFQIPAQGVIGIVAKPNDKQGQPVAKAPKPPYGPKSSNDDWRPAYPYAAAATLVASSQQLTAHPVLLRRLPPLQALLRVIRVLYLGPSVLNSIEACVQHLIDIIDVEQLLPHIGASGMSAEVRIKGEAYTLAHDPAAVAKGKPAFDFGDDPNHPFPWRLWEQAAKAIRIEPQSPSDAVKVAEERLKAAQEALAAARKAAADAEEAGANTGGDSSSTQVEQQAQPPAEGADAGGLASTQGGAAQEDEGHGNIDLADAQQLDSVLEKFFDAVQPFVQGSEGSELTGGAAASTSATGETAIPSQPAPPTAGGAAAATGDAAHESA